MVHPNSMIRALRPSARWERPRALLRAGVILSVVSIPIAMSLAAPSRAIARSDDSTDQIARGEATVRIYVTQTDLYRVTYEELVDAGWPAKPILIAELALEEREFIDGAVDPLQVSSVPIAVFDEDSSGRFDAGDSFVFYGLTAWDRFDPDPRDRRYGRGNSYFVTRRIEGGARMTVGSSYLDREDLGSETDFLTTRRFEGDGIYMPSRAVNESNHPLENGALNIREEHFYWFGLGPGEYVVDFALPGVLQATGLRVALQGVIVPPNSRPAEPAFQVASDPGGGTPTWYGLPGTTVPIKQKVLYEQDASVVGPIPLGENNLFRMELPETGYGAAVDWMEWDYQKAFTSSSDRFDWDTDALNGPRQYDVSGFSSTGIQLYEITDSRAPVALHIDPSQITHGESVSLRTQFDLAGTERRFLALVEDQFGTSDHMEISSAGGPESFARGDLIVITHPDFVEAAARLADHREEQGWLVALVTTREVFDVFGGGRRWPTAIRSYLRYLYQNRSGRLAPTHALLIGDASVDFANVLEESGTNFVPTQTVFSDAFSSQGSELIASDSWFVDNLAGTGEELDFYSDMSIGRLPVGNADEASAVIDKILDYEASETEAWRRRCVLVADDEFSSQISFGPDYRWRGDPNRENPRLAESVFRYASRLASKRIEDATDGKGFEVDSLYPARILDPVACLERCIPITNEDGCEEWICPTQNGEVTEFNREPIDGEANRDYATEEARIPEQLISKMSRGAIFVSFIGHSNWALLAHEYIWRDAPFTGRQDSEHLTNFGRPFVFLGIGGHMGEFASEYEAASRRGDCMAERMLLLDEGRGAVAAISSSAYEWLSEIAAFYPKVIEEWFPESGDPNGAIRIRLGDLVEGAKARMLDESYSNRGMAATYNLLGDPSMNLVIPGPAAIGLDNSLAADRGEIDGFSLGGTRVIPNPTRQGTQFHYSVSGNPQHAQVLVFGADGRKVRTLEGPALLGENVVTWDGRDDESVPVASGVYFYRLSVVSAAGELAEEEGRIVIQR